MPEWSWVAGLLAGGFVAGYAARSLLAWWRRAEAREDEAFDRLFSSGITHLIGGRPEEAIEDLTRAARLRTDVVAVYLILGDLYRDRGQLDRAIRIHASLLGRGEMGRADRAHALASLGEDYRVAGLVDRARESYRQALELEARSLPALKGLLRFEIESRNWNEAADLEEKILRLEPQRSGHTLAFVHYEMGLEALRADDEKGALRAFQKSIAVDERAIPSHIFIGDLHHKAGRTKKARESWEKVIELRGDLLHLVYDRLEQVYEEEGDHDRLEMIGHRLAEKDPGDWRVRLLLAHRENDRGNPESAYRLLLQALLARPGAASLHRELWRMTIQRGLDRRVAGEVADVVKGGELFADPFQCSTCRFRSRAYLWRCPQCHQWDTFADEPGLSAARAGSAASGPPEAGPDAGRTGNG